MNLLSAVSLDKWQAGPYLDPHGITAIETKFVDCALYSPRARNTSSSELCETKNWLIITAIDGGNEKTMRNISHVLQECVASYRAKGLPLDALSEYSVLKIFCTLTSLGMLMWTVFACFVTILASGWVFSFTNFKSTSTVSLLSRARLSCKWKQRKSYELATTMRQKGHTWCIYVTWRRNPDP